MPICFSMVAWQKIHFRIKSEWRGGGRGSHRTLETPGHNLGISIPPWASKHSRAGEGSWEEGFPLSQNVIDLFTYSIHSLPLPLLASLSLALYFPYLQFNSNLLYQPAISITEIICSNFSLHCSSTQPDLQEFSLKLVHESFQQATCFCRDAVWDKLTSW